MTYPLTTNVAVRDWIEARYPGTHTNTIQQHLRFCCVNQPSRVYQGFNKRPRMANDPRYDFLFARDRGHLELYDREKRGVWLIGQDAQGELFIRCQGGEAIYPGRKVRVGQPLEAQPPRPPIDEARGEIEIVEPTTVALSWSEWKPLTQKGKGTPPGPDQPGVYQIRCCVDGGEREIVYIGLSARGVKGLRGRIDNHRSKPGQCADNLVNRQRFWELAEEPIEIRWAVTDQSHYAEAVLLRQFRDEHGRLPRFNTDG